jgi:hypothetical protein
MCNVGEITQHYQSALGNGVHSVSPFNGFPTVPNFCKMISKFQNGNFL